MNWLDKLVKHYRTKETVTDIFGIILYTDAHANIKKVISDDDYWRSFHEISGENWVVFSIRPIKGHYETPKFGPGTMGMMYMIWKEPNENKPLLRELEIEDTSKLPQLLVFTHDEQGNILKSSLKLQDSSIDEAYRSIKESIQVVTNAVNAILLENKENPEGVYQAVRMAVDSKHTWESIKKGVNFFAWLNQFRP